MDLIEILRYIDKRGTAVNLINLKTAKAWCFTLFNCVDTKLSSTRRHIYNKKQLLSETPVVANEVVRTAGVILERNFKTLPLLENYRRFGSVANVLETISGLENTSPEGAISIVYLVTVLLVDYANAYDGTLEEDERLLLQGLIYINFHCLMKLVGLTDMTCDRREVSVYFNECDIKSI